MNKNFESHSNISWSSLVPIHYFYNFVKQFQDIKLDEQSLDQPQFFLKMNNKPHTSKLYMSTTTML